MPKPETDELRLIEVIRSIPQQKTGQQVITERFAGQQADVWDSGSTISWVEPEVGSFMSAVAVEKSMQEIADEARQRAVLETMRRVVDQTDYTKPYPTPLRATNDGITMLEPADNIVQYDQKPALWHPQIWLSVAQIEASDLTEDTWDQRYWDQETPMLDPREVEADIRAMYGDDGLKLAQVVMLRVAQDERSQQYLDQMNHPMRVPVVMMEIWGDAIHSESLEDFLQKLERTMRQAYKDESYILGRRDAGILDSFYDGVQGALASLAKLGEMDSNDELGLFDLLQKIRQEVRSTWGI